MALKNAFENMATESGLRRIANLLTFARDVNDRIRVIVDNTLTTTVYNRNTSTNATAADSTGWQNSSSWNAVDAREPLKLQHAIRSDFVKRNRWTY